MAASRCDFDKDVAGFTTSCITGRDEAVPLPVQARLTYPTDDDKPLHVGVLVTTSLELYANFTKLFYPVINHIVDYSLRWFDRITWCQSAQLLRQS
ncbi:hypothetical protein LMH87_005027 [Akanthomyces muscarius]|uniref:Uncharacterized protein n=1 Tax=Akanthomyces muscarius TaxID=2231603 RepID=A0A9W8QMY7_AKAMU|nr:hypothetical protein LMH87_005027 [Akanthomyces muscarius]KAJ4163287.1 hypothetical protein LMH87_005027 [Akanthomyces muscarius]